MVFGILGQLIFKQDIQNESDRFALSEYLSRGFESFILGPLSKTPQILKNGG